MADPDRPATEAVREWVAGAVWAIDGRVDSLVGVPPGWTELVGDMLMGPDCGLVVSTTGVADRNYPRRVSYVPTPVHRFLQVRVGPEHVARRVRVGTILADAAAALETMTEGELLRLSEVVAVGGYVAGEHYLAALRGDG